MELFDADHARKLTRQYGGDPDLEELDRLIERIKDAARQKSRILTLFDVIKPELKERLERRGFKVEIPTPRYIYESQVTRISW